MRKIGIFSGTFDPVHMGHIAFALQASDVCVLDEVILLPEKHPRLKQPTPIEQRCDMLKLSTDGQPKLRVACLDMPQFTVHDTLPVLQSMFADSELYMLLGSDAVLTFAYRWPGIKDLLQQTTIVVGMRQADTEQEVLGVLQACEKDYGVSVRYAILPSPHAHLASTNIRMGKHKIEDVHPNVADYIKQHQLYL